MSAASLEHLSPEDKRKLLKQLLAKKEAAAPRQYPMTYGQQALWFLQKFVPETYAYNVAFAARLQPSLDLSAFQKALDQLVARHAPLRTIFPEHEGQPVQRVLPPSTVPIRIVEMRDQSDANVYAAVRAEHQQPFSLEAPLFSTTIYRRPADDFLLINVHHLVFDAWSLQVLFEDLRAFYEGEIQGTPAKVAPLAAQYEDFVSWQSQLLSSTEGETLWNYWATHLAGAPPALEITTAFPRPPLVHLRGTTVPFSLPQQQSAAVYTLARSQQTTLYTVMLAAMQVLLYQFSGQTDVTVGTPVSLRSQSEWTSMIGYFINMLPIRGILDTQGSFAEHLARTRSAVHGALSHQEFPFPLMVDRLKIRRELNRSPVFQAMLNVPVSSRTSELFRVLGPGQEGAVRFGGSQLTPLSLPQQEGLFEIIIEITDSDEMLRGNLKYQTDLYSPETAQRMTDTFRTILETVVTNPYISIAELTGTDRDDFEI